MNFVRYVPETGVLTGSGYMDNNFIQAEIDQGNPIIFADNISDIRAWRVNLITKQLEALPPNGIINGSSTATAFSI